MVISNETCEGDHVPQNVYQLQSLIWNPSWGMNPPARTRIKRQKFTYEIYFLSEKQNIGNWISECTIDMRPPSKQNYQQRLAANKVSQKKSSWSPLDFCKPLRNIYITDGHGHVSYVVVKTPPIFLRSTLHDISDHKSVKQRIPLEKQELQSSISIFGDRLMDHSQSFCPYFYHCVVFSNYHYCIVNHLTTGTPLVLVGFVLLDLQFYVYALQIVVCPFVLFLLAIVLSVLRYRDSNYPYGIVKHDLNMLCSQTY